MTQKQLVRKYRWLWLGMPLLVLLIMFSTFWLEDSHYISSSASTIVMKFLIFFAQFVWIAMVWIGVRNKNLPTSQTAKVTIDSH